MAAEQRKLLEQLMGDNLMAMPGTAKPSTLAITDPKVCRSFLCGSCPHDLFTNTKQDLGACSRAHPPNLRDEYQSATEEQRREWGFEFDYRLDISKYVAECDRRIDAAQRRLEKTADEVRQTNALLRAMGDAARGLEAGLREVEILAELGAVNLAVQDFFKLRTLKMAKEDRERELKNLTDTSGPSGHQKLQVCDVCGAYLSRLDNDRRLADHFFGKMHIGYAQMRKENERLARELSGRRPPVRDEPTRDDAADGYSGPPGRSGGYGRGGGGYGRGGGGGYGRRGGRDDYGSRW